MSALMTAPATAPVAPPALPPMPDVPKGFEFIGGRLREMNVSHLSSYVAGEIHFHLRGFVGQRRLGWVSPEGTSFRCFPDEPARLRRPDTAFHLLARLTAEQLTADRQCRVVPDLVVEVTSPNDTHAEVNAKRADWLRAGVPLVWMIDPEDRTVHAYRADGTVTLFGPDGVLTAEPVLPEFRLPMAELFRLPSDPAPVE